MIKKATVDHQEPVNPAGATPHPQAKSRGSSVITFEGLNAPEPADPTPPIYARLLGLLAVLVSGLLGGLIGYGTGDLLGDTQAWPFGGLIIGAATASIGVGIVVSLTLRAMNEWDSAQHPEAELKQKATTKKGLAKLAAEFESSAIDRDRSANDNLPDSQNNREPT